jgi:hypothetical protein
MPDAGSFHSIQFPGELAPSCSPALASFLANDICSIEKTEAPTITLNGAVDHGRWSLMTHRIPSMVTNLGHKAVMDGHDEPGLCRGVPNLRTIKQGGVLHLDLPRPGSSSRYPWHILPMNGGLIGESPPAKLLGLFLLRCGAGLGGTPTGPPRPRWPRAIPRGPPEAPTAVLWAWPSRPAVACSP